MAEQNSIQAAKLLSTPPGRLTTTERHGRRRIMFGQITVVSAAIADTIYFGRVPAGARISGVRLNNAAGTASSTLSLGLRTTRLKTVLSATALASAVSIATAANTDVSASGTSINAGQTYITTEEMDVYGTVAGAATPASQLIAVSLDYVCD